MILSKCWSSILRLAHLTLRAFVSYEARLHVPCSSTLFSDISLSDKGIKDCRQFSFDVDYVFSSTLSCDCIGIIYLIGCHVSVRKLHPIEWHRVIAVTRMFHYPLHAKDNFGGLILPLGLNVNSIINFYHCSLVAPDHSNSTCPAW